jgi:ABC-type nitrate/sulfonate/bicarbonate transport system ATPase subunit
MQSHGTDQPRSAPALAVDAVRCAGLRYRFGAHVAVDQVDLLIAPGETLGLLGPNGAGKTTTIRMLTTLLKPDEGTVTVFGVDAAAQPMRVRRLIGYVPQLLSADASLTGWENVELFARLFDVPRHVRRRRVAEALSAMGLAEAAQRLVKTYSGGMIRRLELAQALVNAPRTLILFEAVALREEREKTESNLTAYIVRSLLSEGEISYPVTVRGGDGEWATKTITKHGPTNLIVTTTAASMHGENETRMLPCRPMTAPRRPPAS